MPAPTRRRVLLSAAGVLGFLAGCNGDAGPSSSPTPTASGPPDAALVDPPLVRLRNPAVAPIVTRPDEDPPTEADADPGRAIGRRDVVGDAETAASLAFADVAGVGPARQFLDATDFAAETVYVEQHAIAECYDLALCWVRWTERSVETAYARRYRDADVACETGSEDVVARLIRLPVALDPDQVREGGTSVTSGRCRGPAGAAAAAGGEAGP